MCKISLPQESHRALMEEVSSSPMLARLKETNSATAIKVFSVVVTRDQEVIIHVISNADCLIEDAIAVHISVPLVVSQGGQGFDEVSLVAVVPGDEIQGVYLPKLFGIGGQSYPIRIFQKLKMESGEDVLDSLVILPKLGERELRASAF